MPTEEEIARYAPDLYADPFYRALRISALAAAARARPSASSSSAGGPGWSGASSCASSSATTRPGSSTAPRTCSVIAPIAPTDQSTNCWWVALLSFGEGWHNNHHAFPFSARHGLRWFEIDMTWWHVELLAFLRLADRIRIPSELMRRRLAMQTSFAMQTPVRDVYCEPLLSR